MVEAINTSYIGGIDTISELTDNATSEKEFETMVKIDHVSMIFNIANERLNSLKEYVIAIARRELMFKEFRALDDVSFEVKRGDVFGILGTNGSGKSTLLKIVAGVLEPSEGTCEVKGKIAPLIELGAGFDMDLTARENVFLNGALLGYSRSFIQEHFDEIIEFAEIEKFLDMPLKNYSSGMVARIAFAIATIIVPEILIVDEVLSVGDFMFQQKCERRISELIKDHGVTVLIVSHNNDQIERLCNKAIWIEKGHTRLIGTAKEVCSTYRAIGGRVGSAESEQAIIELMKSKVSPDAFKQTEGEIRGDDRFSTSVAIAEDYYDDQKRLIMVSSDTPDDSILATSLAGVSKAVTLSTRKDSLPSSTEQAIKRIDLSEIMIIGGADQIGLEIEDELKTSGFKNISRIVKRDKTQMSLAVYEQGKTFGNGWGDTCVVTNRESLPAYISLSREIYAQKMPVFFASDDSSDLNEQIAQKALEFKRIIIATCEKDLPEQLSSALKAMSVEILEFVSKDKFETNIEINRWIITENAVRGDNCLDNLVFCTTCEPVDSYLIGPWAVKKDALVVMVDSENMDSTNKAFGFIREIGGANSVVFLGGKARFNNDDRKVIVNCAILARQQAA